MLWITLVSLTAEDREQFILDNQWSFKHSALLEFGERDNHIDADGEIISRKTIAIAAWFQMQHRAVPARPQTRMEW